MEFIGETIYVMQTMFYNHRVFQFNFTFLHPLNGDESLLFFLYRTDMREFPTRILKNNTSISP